ncbi:MAG: hypothetical protein L6V80_02100 [Bacteroidales bacterium]|nr:MAG: hypothetical protein L6V80_02100 [Bacteroidales bacterium]
MGRSRAGNDGHSDPSSPACLNMPATMSARPRAAPAVTAKSSSARHPPRRHTSHSITT